MRIHSSSNQTHVRDAHTIFEAGLRSVMADRLLGDVDWMAWAPEDLDRYARIVAVGLGKASMALAGAVETQLGDRLSAGVLVVPKGHSSSFPEALAAPHRFMMLEGGHPVPDETSVKAARRILGAARSCGQEDLLLVLISGGGSALCADFTGGITLAEAQKTFQVLLESGADIGAVNTVRKHISRVGGGRLAVAAGDADVLALVISDVVGDDMSVIASGPTVPDPTTAADAVDVLQQFRQWEAVPESVRRHLERAVEDSSLETPKDAMDNVRTRLLGTNRIAVDAAAASARELGYHVEVRSHVLTGEARDVGQSLAAEVRGADPGTCLIWAGETTVTVRGDGMGGRNQELALAASLRLEGAEKPVVLLSAGTDGRDGPTPAPGAVATESTASHAREEDIDPQAYLDRNDAYHFWEAVGGHVITGPTHTNVMDLQVGISASVRQ